MAAADIYKSPSSVLTDEEGLKAQGREKILIGTDHLALTKTMILL